MLSGDVVGMWGVALSDGVYRIEFAHGTTTGKRVVYVNGQVGRGLHVPLGSFVNVCLVLTPGFGRCQAAGRHTPQRAWLQAETVLLVVKGMTCRPTEEGQIRMSPLYSAP